MTYGRQKLLYYAARLSDERIERLWRQAQREYTLQGKTEPRHVSQGTRCAEIVTELTPENTNAVYALAKSLLNDQNRRKHHERK